MVAAFAEYHAPMLALRIKQRPILFTAWFMSSALLLASIATFITGFGYFGNTKQVMFISGQRGFPVFLSRAIPLAQAL